MQSSTSYKVLCPYFDSEVNHKRHFIKITFINKGMEFIDLHSIFKGNFVISSIPNYSIILKLLSSITGNLNVIPDARVRNTISKIVSEYDQEIPQSQTADNPVAPRGRAAQPSQDTRKTN